METHQHGNGSIKGIHKTIFNVVVVDSIIPEFLEYLYHYPDFYSLQLQTLGFFVVEKYLKHALLQPKIIINNTIILGKTFSLCHIYRLGFVTGLEPFIKCLCKCLGTMWLYF